MHGNWTTSLAQVPDVFLEYYKWFLGTRLVDRTPVKTTIVNMGPLVSRDMRNVLNAPYTKEEIKATLWDIDGGKAPRPDGFGSSFFKGVWVTLERKSIML